MGKFEVSAMKPTKITPHIYEVIRLYLLHRISIDEAVRILPPKERRKFRYHPYWSVLPNWTRRSLRSVKRDFARITVGRTDPLEELIQQGERPDA
jgi:hypothetical protein